MTSLNMSARKDSVPRIKPVIAQKTRVGTSEFWMIYNPLESVRMLFDSRFHTSQDAIRMFCESNDLSESNIIVKYEDEATTHETDDPIEIVRNVTDGNPLATLSLDDASTLIEEAKRQGYSVPDMLTPNLFLSIYEDLKPEEN